MSVHAKSATRYMGFVPSYKRDAPTLKCGETLEGRATKLSRSAPATGNGSSGRWTSTSTLSMGAVSVADYERQLAANAAGKAERAQRSAQQKFIGVTTQEAAFGAARGRAVQATTRSVPSFLLVSNVERVTIRRDAPASTSGQVSEKRTNSHPPGYGGFLPISKNNARAVQQSALAVPRESREGGSLAARYSHEVSGYTGHQPATITNSTGPRGASALTTAGEASRWL
jgi:hypothetical protein